MSDVLTLADSQDRLLAETTWDRNVVVVAGAGTGKTTILVNRILNLLLREPNPLAITEIVALTFTNKAATEMKQRLRAQLLRLTEQADDMIATFRTRYHLSAEQVGERARTALEQMEKLRSAPCIVLPRTSCDSIHLNLKLIHYFKRMTDHASRNCFTHIGTVGWTMSSDQLDHSMTDGDESWLEPPSMISSSLPLPSQEILWTSMSWNVSADPSRWRVPCVTGSRPHMAVLPLFLPRRIDQNGVRRNRCSPLQCSRWHSCWKQGPPGLAHLSQDERAVLEKDLGKPPAGWDEAAFQEAASIIGLAQQLLTVDQSYFQEVVTLVRPFLASRTSWVSHLRVDRIRWVIGTGQNPLARPSGRPRSDQTDLSGDPGG